MKTLKTDDQPPGTGETLQAENEELRRRLEEAEETIGAIRSGAVDALVIEQPEGHRIYTLEGAERPYRLFVEEMQQGAATLHPDGTIAWCNAQLAKLLKMPQEKLLGAALHDFVPRNDRVVYDNLLWQGQTRSGRGECHLQWADGGLVPVFLTFNALPKDCGAAIGVLVTDLTSQRHHEQLTAAHEALRQAEQELRDFLENASVAMHWVGPDGIIIWANQTELDLLGYRREEYIGHPITDFHADEPVIQDILCRLARGDRLRDCEARMRCKDGSTRHVLIDSNVLFVEGKFVHSRCFTRDITERKQAEGALQAAQTQLQEHARELERRVAERTADLQATNKQLEAFVYSIAHDLRSPLRSMEGFSAMLLEEAGSTLSETGREFANRICRSAQFMDALLKDLLAFSRMSQQRIELVSVNLETIVQSILARLEGEIRDSSARVEIVGSWPAVLAHEPTLGQVLFNLLSNALKFVTPGVPPRVRLRVEEPETSSLPAPDGKVERVPGSWVRVWVEDNGIGIAPDHQEQIFRLFTRLHGKKYPGTGLGLAIVQKGIERMGGRVGVESNGGEGSRFWFELRKA